MSGNQDPKTHPGRFFPVRPNLRQIKIQAKELLRDFKVSTPEAIAEFNTFHPKTLLPETARLNDAQLTLARSYGAPSWPRLVQSCNLIDAIWRNDTESVRKLVSTHPHLLHENAGIRNNNWGPPMTYAANLGRDEIIKLLRDFGATDLETAIDRAVLQSKIGTARMIHEWLGSPAPLEGALDGPAYTLSESGTRLVLELGAKVYRGDGQRIAPVDVVLETDSRNPSAKHEILALYEKHGFRFPDTPTMALHLGRIDLLEEHLRRYPKLLERTFTHEEIYPPELGCHDEVLATQGTPLRGTTLLHLCVDYDELEIARWLLDQGMDPNVRAVVDENGFGGHTALFCTVVSQPNYWMNRQEREPAAPFTKLLLERGADPNILASLRKQLHPGYGPRYDVENVYEYRNVTALGWGRQFHAKVFVSEPAMKLIEEYGGVEDL